MGAASWVGPQGHRIGTWGPFLRFVRQQHRRELDAIPFVAARRKGAVLHVKSSPARSDIEDLPRQTAQQRILGPLAPSSFDAIDDCYHKHHDPHPHEAKPELRSDDEESQRWRRVLIRGVVNHRQNERAKPQHHEPNNEDQVDDLQEQSL